jgi:hypothetical protein
MAYWVYGRDAETGELVAPLLSDEPDETGARAQAASQGMLVEAVEYSADASRGAVAPRRARSSPFLPRTMPMRVCWHLGGLLVLAGVLAIILFATSDWRRAREGKLAYDRELRALEEGRLGATEQSVAVARFRWLDARDAALFYTAAYILAILLGLALRFIGRPRRITAGIGTTEGDKPQMTQMARMG